MRIYQLFIIVALISAVSATCIPSIKKLYVPAILSDESSGMVQIGVETRPGAGEVFISVTPAAGFYTQQSEKVAAEVAFRITGKRDCDVFLRIYTTVQTTQVDGPSAGAAITLLVLSSLEQSELRNDFTITGTIEEDGSIGPVGGIPLKAEASAKLGKKLFLVPLLTANDKLSLMVLQKYYNLTVVESTSIEGVYNITLSDPLPTGRLVLSPEAAQTFAHADISNSNKGYFADVAKVMVEIARATVSSSDSSVKSNFESRLSIAEEAYSNGHLYTAANTAFLLLIDSDYLAFSDDLLQIHANTTDSCIASYSPKALTANNFELVGASELRYLWSIKRRPQFNESEFVAIRLSKYYDLLFSEYWCKAATALNTNVPVIANSTGFDQELLRDLAEGYLAKAKKATIDTDDPDLSWHLGIAQDGFDKKLYAPSIFDSVFVISGAEAEKNGTMVANFSSEVLRHLWPQLYAAHAKTYEADKITSARLYLYASELEKALSEVDEIARVGGGIKNGSVMKVVNATYLEQCYSVKENEERLSVLIVLLIIAFIAYFAHNLKITAKKEERRLKR